MIKFSNLAVHAEGGEVVVATDEGKVGIKEADVDHLVSLLHAFSNMRRLGIDLKSKLLCYGNYIVVRFKGSAYTVVGYVSMGTYTMRGHYYKTIGDTLFTRDGVTDFPPPATQAVAKGNDLYPSCPTCGEDCESWIVDGSPCGRQE